MTNYSTQDDKSIEELNELLNEIRNINCNIIDEYEAIITTNKSNNNIAQKSPQKKNSNHFLKHIEILFLPM